MRLFIKNGHLIDPAAPENTGMSVLIEDGKISAVGKNGAVKIPPGFVRVEARGKTLLPGLWDTHAHATQPEWFPASLAAGITTMRDAANELEFIVPIRDAIRSEKIKNAPRLLLAGYIDSGANAVAPAGVERARGVEVAHPGHDDAARHREVSRRARCAELGAECRQCLAHGSQIAGAIIDERDHSSSFVLGSIFAICRSFEHATRNARANALKHASTL